MAFRAGVNRILGLEEEPDVSPRSHSEGRSAQVENESPKAVEARTKSASPIRAIKGILKEPTPKESFPYTDESSPEEVAKARRSAKLEARNPRPFREILQSAHKKVSSSLERAPTEICLE